MTAWRVIGGFGHRKLEPAQWGWLRRELEGYEHEGRQIEGRIVKLRDRFGAEVAVSQMGRGFDLEWFDVAEKTPGLAAHACIPCPEQAKSWLAPARERWRLAIEQAGGISDDNARVHVVGNLADVAPNDRSVAMNRMLDDATDEMLLSCNAVVALYDPQRKDGRTHQTFLKARGEAPVRGRRLLLPIVLFNPATMRVHLVESHIRQARRRATVVCMR